MSAKIIKCTVKDCPTPYFPYDEEIPSTTPVASLIRTMLEDFLARKTKKKTDELSEINFKINNDTDDKVSASFKLDELVEELEKKINQNTVKTDDKGDIKVVFCDTGHPNYIID